MKTLAEQLITAYRQEEELYGRVLELVEEQTHIMAEQPSPRRVLQLCREVEDLMGDIEAVERAIRPVKEAWEKEKSDPTGELDRILASIEKQIERIGELQQDVQEGLLAYVEREKHTMDEARASINARRAGNLYRAG
jgi:regulator of replication initiation timing